MKNVIQLFALVWLILSSNAYGMEQSWPQKAISKFVDRMLNTITYTYKSPEHVTSLACIFAMPQSIGQYVLYKQRSNMKTFLKQNEADKLEAIRKHYDVNPQKWQAAIEKTDAEHSFNLNAMRKPGNNYDVLHDPNLPQEWIAALSYASKIYDININNLNLKYGKLSNDKLASARTYSPSNDKYIPGCITLYKTTNASRPLKHTAFHEMTHIAQGHSLHKNLINTIIPPIIPIPKLLEIPEIPNLQGYDDVTKEKKKNEYTEKRNEYNERFKENKLVRKQNKKTLNMKESLLESCIYKEYKAATEKTADTYLCCDCSFITANFVNRQKLLKKYFNEITYPDNENDINVLHGNWKTAQAIENSRKLYRHITKQPENFMTQLTCKARAYTDIFA